MGKTFNIGRQVLKAGGWAPLLVLATHVLIGRVLHAYEIWPHIDIPMHFSGGVAIAFLISGCFQLLPRQPVKRSRIVLLELLLVGSLTICAAVFWEFGEFAYDRIFGTNVQISLANTMQDLAMGTLGAALFILIRSRQLRVGISEVREITFDWIHGQAARY